MGKEKESALMGVHYYPMFRFILRVSHYECKSNNSLKGKKVASHIVGTVLGDMWYKANGKNGMCTASIATISRETGISVSGVKMAIQILEEIGIVRDSGEYSELGTKKYYVFESAIKALHDEYIGSMNKKPSENKNPVPREKKLSPKQDKKLAEKSSLLEIARELKSL